VLSLFFRRAYACRDRRGMSNSDIILQGRLLDDPELRFTASGIAVAKAVIMVSERKRNAAGEWENGETSFVTCNAWRQMAESMTENLRKGDQVLAVGRLEQRKYETKDGEKRSSWEVTLSNIGKSLMWLDKEKPSTPARQQPSGYDDGDVPF
jgi:single-strand DNA-binding protein